MERSMACRDGLLAALVALSLAMPVDAAASDVYARIAATGAASAAGEHMTVKSTYSDSLSSTERAEYSLGKGLSLDAAVGVALSPGISGEVSVGYLYGLETLSESSMTLSGSTSINKDSVSGRMLRLQPAIAIRSQLAKTTVYGRFGVLLGLATALTHEEETEAGVVTVAEAELTGGFALGFTGAVGVELAVGDRVDLFAEAAYVGVSYQPTSASLVKYTENGADKLGSLTTRKKETEFQDSVTTDTSAQPNEGAAKLSPMVRIPFSNVGVGLGVKFRF